MTKYQELSYLGNGRFLLTPDLDENFLLVIQGLVMIPPIDYVYNKVERTVRVTAAGDFKISKVGGSFPNVKGFAIKLYDGRRVKP
jgi:hypothetical protein